MTGVEEGPPRTLLTVRAGEGGFRAVTHSAREAVAFVAQMTERGLGDVHALGGDRQRLDPETLTAMARAETTARASTSGQG